MKKNTTASSALALACALLLTACNDNRAPDSDPSAQTASPAVQTIAARFTNDIPAGAVSVEEARKTPAGGKITVKGTLLGREHIFVDKAAIFIIGDPDKIEIEEAESKPWIACCTPPDIIKVHTLTVQFVDGDGQLIMHTAKGVNGLKELDQVVISGAMDKTSTPEAPVLNIDSISIIKQK